MILRTASRDDLGSIRGVLVEWWEGRDLTALLQPLFLENFATTSLIAEDDDGGLAGFLVGFPSTDDPSAAYVHFVGVAPSHRRVGVGRRLHEEFAARMSARGVATVRCVTSPVNEASVAFHQRIGFEVESRDAEYVHLVRRSVAPGFAPRVDPRPDDAAWPTAQWPIEPSTVLSASGITLRLARPVDAAALFAALDHDACWAHVRGRPESEDDMLQSILEATRQGRWMWVVERAGAVVGTTSFLEVSPVDARLEIGFTIYAPEAWATEVNPACKFLLMQWAFDHGFGRVQLKTDIRNARSQRAIARLGAGYEGVLRRYQRRQDGSVRDTVVFSVTAEDWPRVRDGLLGRLKRGHASTMDHGRAVRRVGISTGVSVAYVERGDPDGSTVVLLHAWAESMRCFDRMAAALPATWHVVAFDQRGHGDTDKPRSGYGLESLARDVVAFMDALELASAVLVGASSGGYVAQQVAVDSADRVDGLVLLGTPRSLHGRATFADETDVLVDPIDPQWARAFVDSFPLEHVVPTEFVDDRVDDALRVPADVWRASLAGLTGSVPPTDAGAITAPTLILWGDRDPLVSREDQDALAAAVADGRLQVYAGVGHLVLWEQPERVARDLAAFVAELGRRGAQPGSS